MAMDPENRSGDEPLETRELSDEEFEEVLDRCIERDREILGISVLREPGQIAPGHRQAHVAQRRMDGGLLRVVFVAEGEERRDRR